MYDDMTKSSIRQNLERYVQTVTTKSKGNNMYVCPLCNSGTGHNKTGAFSIKGDKWKCFSCGASGDIFELYGQINNVSEFGEQFKALKDLFNIDDKTPKIQAVQKQEEKEQQNKDYTDFFLKAHNDAHKTDYFKKRGLTTQTIDKYCLGYVENWSYSEDGIKSNRIIIPTSKYTYSARLAEEKGNQIKYIKVGTVEVFNLSILSTSEKPIFITEGEINALSIIEVGADAVAIGSTTQVDKFIKTLEKTKPKKPIIISFDNDESGQKATVRLKEGLDKLNIPSISINHIPRYNDVNEMLIENKAEFKKYIEYQMKRAEEHGTKETEKSIDEYYKATSARYLLSEFIDGIKNSVNTPSIPTNFKNLDNALDGGLYEGLYVIGAISSLGKTTFIMQIADQIAESGQDVLIFSLEMSKNELISKSISRETIKISKELGVDARNAKTARGITDGNRYPNYNDTEKDLIKESIKKYDRYANHLFILEGVGDIGVNQVRESVQNHIKYTGNAPVVIIDYIQILAPYNERATDKQNTDKAVMELKRLSRDCKVPIIGISSLNREHYNDNITMTAFKESGAIEYSSDILIGLQLKGAGEKGFNATEEKKKTPRQIELIILKNRNGRVGYNLSYEYYPMFNLFEEVL